MARPTNPADLSNALSVYQSGKTLREVTAITGISSSVLHRAIHKAGIFEPRRKHATPDGLITDFLGGMSVKAAAAKYGFDRNAAYRMLDEAGIDGRDRSAAMRLRWQRATDAERAQMLAAAHDACRGRIVTDRERVSIAAAKAGRPLSERETALGAMLTDLGLEVAYGVPCGPYNVDIVVSGTVAVEVFGGHWHESGHHRECFPERSRHILDAGYSLAIVWDDLRRHPVGIRCAQHLATLAEITRGHPAIRRQHWVIRGDGYFLAVREDDGNEVPFVSASGRRNG